MARIAARTRALAVERGETCHMKVEERLARAQRYISFGYSAKRVSEICDIAQSWVEQIKQTGRV
jgi:hypothetical protein